MSATALTCGVLAATSAALMLRGGTGVREVSPSRLSRWSLACVAAVLAFTSWAWLDAHDLLLAGVTLLTAGGVFRIIGRRRAVADAARRADEVLAACESIASDLTAGQPPSTALQRASVSWPELAPVAAAGEMGADVPAAMREVARQPGAGQLRRVAATWQVAHETGAGLAQALHTAAAAIREEMRLSRLVATELAAAHATARMLAVLPLGVLVLGMGVGGDPVGFLLGSTPGVLVLAAGLGLSFLGLSWLERIADRVLR